MSPLTALKMDVLVAQGNGYGSIRVMVINEVNGINDLSSNPGQGDLHFISG